MDVSCSALDTNRVEEREGPPVTSRFFYRAGFARVFTCGSPHRGRVSFLCSRKEKKPKESAPSWRDNPLRIASRACGRPTGPPCPGGRRARSLARPFGRSARGWRCSRAPYGVLKTPPRTGLSWVAQNPVGTSRAPSQAGSLRETFDRARGALCAPGELGERPAVARRAGDRERYWRAAKRPGRISFGDFWLAPSLARALRAR